MFGKEKASYTFTPDEIIIGTAMVWIERKKQYEPEFLTLSEDGGENGPVVMREAGNIVCVGAPGSGKTRLIEAQLLNWGQSIVVIDLKGGLYRTTAAHRHSLGPVIVLDPRDGRGSRFNPVAVIREKARRTLAQEIVSRGRDDADPFWTSVAAEFWQCCWYAADEVERPHIPYAVEIINMGLLGALRYLAAYHGENAKVRRILSNFMTNDVTPELLKRIQEQGASKLVESKWASIVESASPFQDQGMLNIFNGHDFDPARLFKKSTTIYIMADETDSEGFAMFARLVMKTLGDALIMAGDKLNFNERLPILFLFDEFGAIRINNVRQWLNTMRSRGLILWLFVQSLSQLPSESRGNYDAERENSIHHWILFASTAGNNEVGQWVSNLSGMVTTRVSGGDSTSQSFTEPGGGSYSSSFTYKERHNVESEDVDTWAMNQAAVSLRANGAARRFYGPVTIVNAADVGLLAGVPRTDQQAPLLSAYVPPTFEEPVGVLASAGVRGDHPSGSRYAATQEG